MEQLQVSLNYKSSSCLKLLALSHCNVTREKHPTAAPPQLALPWLLSGSADLGLGSIWQQEWHFSTSTSNITSFMATWFLWGFKRFLQKAAPENNPCHVGWSQQSASGLNLIRWHTQCISSNFGGKKPNNQKSIYVFCVIILQEE